MSLLDSVLLSLIFFTTVFLVTILLFDFINLIKGYPPSLSSKKSTIRNIKEIYKFTPNQKVADFGAGYGNILRELKDSNVRLTGVELNPILCLLLKIKFRNYQNINIIRQDFLKLDLSKFNVVIIYGIAGVMSKLEKK